MQYRKFGKLDWQVSALGFGCMRLPTLEGDRSRIDEPEATRMLHWAIDAGVNYLDTAYPYHDGNSERVVGRALQGGYRQKVRLATKMPTWLIESSADFDRYLNEQLQKLGTDHIDFYLLHGLSAERWPKVRDLGVREWAEGAIASGRIRHIGFSFHDKTDVLRQIIDEYDRWALCQIQYNYMDVENQAGTAGLRYAASKGLAVVVMEPLLGGRLVNPPVAVQALWDMAPVKRSPSDWALQWLWSQPEVSVALSGMSAMEQVEQNLASAAASRVGLLTAEELALVDRVRAAYQALCPIPCTACNYCMPCPNGVAIPQNFAIFNNGRMYNQFAGARAHYARTKEEERASACIGCRECETKCPQHIPIADWMPIVDEVLGLGRDFESCTLPG